MKKLLSDPDAAVCSGIRSLLESHGIACALRNDEPHPTLKGLVAPGVAPLPEVWVRDDDRFEDALAILHPDPAPATTPEGETQPEWTVGDENPIQTPPTPHEADMNDHSHRPDDATEAGALRKEVRDLRARLDAHQLLAERRRSTLTCYMENLLISAGLCRIITRPDFGVIRTRNTLPIFGRVPANIHIAELFGTDTARHYFQRIRQLRVDMLSLAERVPTAPWKPVFDSSIGGGAPALRDWIQYPARAWDLDASKAATRFQEIQYEYYLSSPGELIGPDEDFRIEYTGVSSDPATELTAVVGAPVEADERGMLVRHPDGDGYTFAFGASRNLSAEIQRRLIPLIATDRMLVRPGVPHRCVAERIGGLLRLIVDDIPVCVVVDPLPISGKGHGFVSFYLISPGQTLRDIRVFTRPTCLPAGVREEIDELGQAVLDARRGDQVRYLRVHYQTPERYHFSDVSNVMEERLRTASRDRSLLEATARADKMQSLAAMAAGVAHDLNNIMGPIVGFPSMIRDQLDTLTPENFSRVAQDVRQDLEAIDWAAKRASMVVSDLLTLSRRGHYTRKPLDLNQLISNYLQSREMLSLREDHPQVDVIADMDLGKVNIQASESHLLRVIGNLVRNACEACADRGEVRISTSAVKTTEALIGVEVIPPGSYILLQIGDTGSGIDPRHLSRLFEPFFSTKAKTKHSGTGLGLAVVHGIVKDHGGFLNVRTTLGRGTTFEIYLPATDGKPAELLTEDPRIHTGTGHVMVVDDSDAQRTMARRMLTRLGYQVTTVPHGHAAVKLFQDSHQSRIPLAFDLVLLDMVMEEGYDGLTTFQDIRKLYPKQKVIIVSGFSPTERAAEAIDQGAGWLAKPYTLPDLAQAVERKLKPEEPSQEAR